MMSAYSEDLRRRIVSSVEGGMPKAQAARTYLREPLLCKTVRKRGRKRTIPGSEEEARIGPQARRESDEATAGGPVGTPVRQP